MIPVKSMEVLQKELLLENPLLQHLRNQLPIDLKKVYLSTTKNLKVGSFKAQEMEISKMTAHLQKILTSIKIFLTMIV